MLEAIARNAKSVCLVGMILMSAVLGALAGYLVHPWYKMVIVAFLMGALCSMLWTKIRHRLEDWYEVHLWDRYDETY